MTAVGSLAGCLDSVPFFGDDEEEEATVDVGPVPKNVDMVARADTEALLGDGELRAGLDGGIETLMVGGDPGSVTELLGWLEDVYGLDPAGITRAVGFTDVTPAEPIESTLGALVEASWSPESIPRSLEAEGFRTSERTVEGVTVYDIDREISQVAILEEGRYLIGTEDAVETVVAIENGEADSLSGGPLTAFRAAGDGIVRFGVRVEPLIGTITTLFPVAAEQVADLLSNVETMGGRVVSGLDRRRLELRFDVVNESRAGDFENVLGIPVAAASSQAEEGEPIARALDAISIARDGTTVTLTYEAPVAELEAQVPALLGLFVGPVIDLPDPDEIDLPGG